VTGRAGGFHLSVWTILGFIVILIHIPVWIYDAIRRQRGHKSKLWKGPWNDKFFR
jgi:hypothetical protein